MAIEDNSKVQNSTQVFKMDGIHLLTDLLGLYVAPAQKDCEQLTFSFFRQKTKIEKCKKENTDNTITTKNNILKNPNISMVKSPNTSFTTLLPSFRLAVANCNKFLI